MPDKFVVPQFIDKEDKILGPITVRQFLICLATVGVGFAEYTILQTLYFVFAALITVVVGMTFAFVKINGQPFHIFFVNFLQTQVRPRIRVWDRKPTDVELRRFLVQKQEAVEIVAERKPRPASSHLRDLALTVNTGGVYNPDQDT